MRSSRPAGAPLGLGTAVALVLFACCGTATAQWGKGSPLGKGGYLDKKRSSQSTPASADGTPAVMACDIDLGQKVKGTLPVQESVGTVSFHGLRGTKTRFALTFRGSVGESKVTLRTPGGGVLETFKAEAATFRLEEYELPRTDTYEIRILHRGKGELAFTMTSSGKLPEFLEESLVLALGKPRGLQIDGFPGRAIRSIRVTPAAASEKLDLALALRPNSYARADAGDEVTELAAMGITAASPNLKLRDELAADDIGGYRLDITLEGAVEAEAKPEAVIRIAFANPRPATGTVELRASD